MRALRALLSGVGQRKQDGLAICFPLGAYNQATGLFYYIRVIYFYQMEVRSAL